MTNWDLLRSLSMLAVLVVHSGTYLEPLLGVPVGSYLSRLALVCDPVFFVLSGYFAIREPKRSLPEYWFHKFVTIIVPFLVYATVMYPLVAGFGNLSLGGFAAFLAGRLSPWWFITHLFPFLVLAPFMFTMLEALSDRQVRTLGRLFLVMTAWSVVCSGGAWVANLTGHAGLASAFVFGAQIVPSHLMPMDYLLYFLMGYFLRRLSLLLSERTKSAIVVGAAFACLLDLVYFRIGAATYDPSDLWMFVTPGIFFLFDRIKITGPCACKVLSWTAARSYAIYLLNAAAIAVVFPLFRDVVFAGAFEAGLWAPWRLLVWLASLLCAYALALAAASLVDVTLVRWAQTLVRRCGRAVARLAAPKGTQAAR